MQDSPEGDFEVEVKFSSPVVSRYQMQGIVVQQDATNLVRFEVHHDGSTPRLFDGTVVANSGTARANVAAPGLDQPIYVRVALVGDAWTMRSSGDGATWTNVATFSHTMTVTQVGFYAGNYGIPKYSSPAFTGSIDHFRTVVNEPTPNQAPTASDDSASTLVDTPVAVDVLANDSDPDGSLDPATVVVVSPSSSGTAGRRRSRCPPG